MNKISKHLLIFMAAIFFDYPLGLIPVVSLATNWIFTGILLLYFGGKNFNKTLKRMAIGSLLDSFLSFLPPCTYATYKRIMESD